MRLPLSALMPDLLPSLSPIAQQAVSHFASIWQRSPEAVLAYLLAHGPLNQPLDDLILRTACRDFPIRWFETAHPERLEAAIAQEPSA